MAEGTAGPVTLTHSGQVAVVMIDNPPVNAASHAVRAGRVAAFTAAENDPEVRGIVLAAAGRTFTAGADITEFAKPPQAPVLTEVVEAIEASTKPVVAVLHGTALGGGLELALGCHYRVIDPAGAVGLPETTLGLIPGAGGTQRLPRLVGLAAAADIVATGRRVAAAEALELGIVDAITSGDRLAFAIEFLTERLEAPVRRLGALPGPSPDEAGLEAARAAARKRLAGQEAPLRGIDAVALATGPFEAGQQAVAAMFAELRLSDQSKALRYIFFAERTAGHFPELQAARPRSVETVGVVGGGTMGAAIAAAALLNGLGVVLAERDAAATDAARGRVEAILADSVKRGKLTETARSKILAARFSATADLKDLAGADLVVEAAFEDMAVKQELFGHLGGEARADAVLATNTSYLNVGAIAAAAEHPERVIGLHFFSPAHVMRLMEIVVPDGASAEAVATGHSFAKRLGKIAVRSGVGEGFIGNRILSAYRKAADYMVEDGASPYEIDAALRGFGFAMGVYETQDLSGLDIGYATRRRLDATRDPRERYVAISDRLVQAGRLGRKTGRGYYAYDGAKQTPDPEVEAVVAAERAARAISPRSFTEAEIVDRVLAAMVNESARILAEGIAQHASDIDVVLVNGYGYQRWRGGPMHTAEARGLPTILAGIHRFAEEDEYFWQPAPLLVSLAESGGSFPDAATNELP